MNKLFGTSVELKSNQDVVELNGDIKIEYYLLEGVLNNNDELDGKSSFGIEIIKKVNNSVVECTKFENISSSKENTYTILNILAKNAVTPVSMEYVLEDILGA